MVGMFIFRVSLGFGCRWGWGLVRDRVSWWLLCIYDYGRFMVSVCVGSLLCDQGLFIVNVYLGLLHMCC